MQRDAKLVSYDIVDKGGKPYVSVDMPDGKKTFSPEEVRRTGCGSGGGGVGRSGG